MADNYSDNYVGFLGMDPATESKIFANTNGFTQAQLEAMWNDPANTAYVADRAAYDDPNQWQREGRTVKFGDQNNENDVLLQRGPDGQIYTTDKLNHGWTREFLTNYALPIVAAGGASAYGIANAGASAGGGMSGMDLAADAAAGSGNNLYTAAGSFGGAGAAGGMSGMDLAADGGANGISTAGGGGLGGGETIGGQTFDWNPEGFTGKTPALAGGGFGGGGVSGFLDGMTTKDWLNLGGSLLNGYLGSQAANKAANIQSDAAREGNALLKYMYDTTRQDNLPALNARNAGLTGYQNLLKNPGSVTQDPGYKFGLDQGTNAIGSQAAAGGNYYSGATLKALNKFGQDYAGTKFDQALNRQGNLAGLGQVGSNTIGQAGMNYGNQASQNMIGAGNARGAASLAGANAWQNALNSYMGYQQFQNMFGG